MKNSWLGDRSASGWFCGAVLVATLLSSVPSYAQKAECAAGKKRGDGADIQCRMDAILAKHDALIGKVKGKLDSCRGPNCDLMQEHLKKVQAAQQRAKTQHGRVKQTEYDELNTTTKAKCKGGKNCFTTPEDVVVEEEPDNGQGADLADQLDDIGEGLDKSAELLDAPAGSPQALAALQAFASPASGFQPLYDYTADPDYPAWLHVGDNPKAIIPAAFAITIAAGIAEGIDRVASNFCQQDIFGFNGSVVCSVFSVLAVALETTATLLNFNMSDATAWDAHGAYLRAKNLNDNLETVNGSVANVGSSVATVGESVGETKAAVDAVQGQVKQVATKLDELGDVLTAVRALQNQLIQLLLNPEGRRSVPASVLTCNGSTCPPVVLTCSGGVCSFNK